MRVSNGAQSTGGWEEARHNPPCWTKSADYCPAVPTINLTDDELAPVTEAIRRTIEDDRFPHAPRLDPLRAALGKLEAAAKSDPLPKVPPPAKDERARRTP